MGPLTMKTELVFPVEVTVKGSSVNEVVPNVPLAIPEKVSVMGHRMRPPPSIQGIAPNPMEFSWLLEHIILFKTVRQPGEGCRVEATVLSRAKLVSSDLRNV